MKKNGRDIFVVFGHQIKCLLFSTLFTRYISCIFVSQTLIRFSQASVGSIWSGLEKIPPSSSTILMSMSVSQQAIHYHVSPVQKLVCCSSIFLFLLLQPNMRLRSSKISILYPQHGSKFVRKWWTSRIRGGGEALKEWVNFNRHRCNIKHSSLMFMYGFWLYPG